jgi:AraC family transcriptional regulator
VRLAELSVRVAILARRFRESLQQICVPSFVGIAFKSFLLVSAVRRPVRNQAGTTWVRVEQRFKWFYSENPILCETSDLNLTGPASPRENFSTGAGMHAANQEVGSDRAAGDRAPSPAINSPLLRGVGVVREGRQERFLEAAPTVSSSAAHWQGIAIEDWNVPAVLIPRHEHPEHFLHVVLRGTVKYQVATKGRLLSFSSRPGTIFLLPRGTVDEVNWAGPTHRVAVAIHPQLLTGALEETAHQADVELREHWDLVDPHISALVTEMTADLGDRSPAGTIYGEALANALAVYLVKRYAVRPITPAFYKGGLSAYRLKRVLDYISENLESDISLSDLATTAGMSPHYFSELFKQSTGRSPHNYVLLQRVERAKQLLRDPKRSVLEAGLDAGFENPSHFARMFRRIEGTTPSRFRAGYVPTSSA